MLSRIPGRSQTAATTITQRYAARHGDRRYLNEFVRFCQQNHLFGDRYNLSDIAVEPRFIPPDPLVSAPEEEVDPDVFRVVPQNHTYPFMHAPYNIPTLGIPELSQGTQRIALLGVNGSGRTTALMCIALWSLELLDFKPPYDKIQAQIDRYEEKLSPEERANRIKHRIRVAQQAQERMAEADGGTYIGTGDEEEDHEVNLLRRTIPIYCHLASLSRHLARAKSPLDPAEQLIESLQDQYSFIAAKTLPQSLYRAIATGHALLLIDGYEDLNETEQQLAQTWLEALISTYPNNTLIVTGLPTGYHWLSELDIVPVFLRPWTETNVATAISNQFKASETTLNELVYIDLVAASQLLHPVDIALLSNIVSSDSEMLTSQAGQWPHHFLDQRLADLEAWLPYLQQLAEQELDTGRVTVGVTTEKQAVLHTWTPFDIASDTAEDTTEKSRERMPQRRTQLILTHLKTQGVLRQLAPGQYQFRHHVLAAYIAAQGLQYAEETELIEKASQPRWMRAIGYAAELVPIDAAVRAHLQQPKDVLLSHVLDITQWLAYAGKQATWRQHILRLLGNMFVAPNQFIRVREQIAAALVASRDEGSKMILRAALQNPNPDIRILSSLGLGALHDAGAINPLRKLFTIPDEMVQISATLALGAIGTKDALNVVLEAMQRSENRGVRRAAAEMLAMYPDIGYETLYKAINEETDILLRRAILFGLGRIRTNWALITINEVVSSGKEEYYVRLAAMEVFRVLYEKESQGVNGYPSANAIPWLLEWGQQQQRTGAISDDVTGDEMLSFALESRQPQTRYLALLTITQLGLLNQISNVYKHLHDPNEAVRDTAYRTLAHFQNRLGTDLPLPI